MTDEKPLALVAESPKHPLDQRAASFLRPPKIPRITGEIDDDDGEEVEEQKESILSLEAMNQSPRLQRYLVAIEYIGTRFAGAQKQPNCRTVVGVLEEAFHKFIGQPVSIFCSSRTDAGVHALSNVCHVDVERISKRRPGEVLFIEDKCGCDILQLEATKRNLELYFQDLNSDPLNVVDMQLPPHEPAVVRRAVNHFLQKNEGDITVIDVRCVPPDFHARFKAQERTYFYRLLSGPEPLSTFEKDRAWHVPENLNLSAMQGACRVLVGRHDFSSFRAASCQAKSPIRNLDELSVTRAVSTPYFPSIIERDESNFVGQEPSGCLSESKGDLPHVYSMSSQEKITSSNSESNYGFGTQRRHCCYVITARARSFLYHQVRLLVGVLKAVGTGELTIPDVERILDAKTVTAASPMAPACGLYLGSVKYVLPSDL